MGAEQEEEVRNCGVHGVRQERPGAAAAALFVASLGMQLLITSLNTQTYLNPTDAARHYLFSLRVGRHHCVTAPYCSHVPFPSISSWHS